MKRKNNYSGIGLCFGSGIGTIAAVLTYVFTHNPVFFVLVAIGTGLGVIFDAIMHSQKKKNEK